jgi:hypothetical protein
LKKIYAIFGLKIISKLGMSGGEIRTVMSIYHLYLSVDRRKMYISE